MNPTTSTPDEFHRDRRKDESMNIQEYTDPGAFSAGVGSSCPGFCVAGGLEKRASKVHQAVHASHWGIATGSCRSDLRLNMQVEP